MAVRLRRAEVSAAATASVAVRSSASPTPSTVPGRRAALGVIGRGGEAAAEGLARHA